MYNVDVAAIREARAASGHSIWLRVSRTVLILGAVSCFTDISSEMVASVLPIYVLVHLQLSPLQFGVVDGLYQGVTALARLASGVLADRSGRHKIAAVAGYGLSALCKL
ncbi:MAG TPA: MFS transporter, partial [Vicinamibacterales bacterium]